MVTSAEFDEVLVPVDYQKDVLMRTFDSLIGFNKKNKKGKFMKAIKEELRWENGKPVYIDEKKERKDELEKEFKRKRESGQLKVINLDAKKSKPAVTAAKKKEKTAEEKAKDKELYKGYLLNKVGKTNAQIEKEIRDRNASHKAISKERPEPGDTHYTCKEIADYVYEHSSKARQRWLSNIHLWDDLLKNEKLRKSLDEKIIAKIGHKPEDEKKTVRKTASETKAKAAAKIEKAKLETDIHRIADWFWDKRNTKDFKIIFPDIDNYGAMFRIIQNDDRGKDWYAKIMYRNGYVKPTEKPFNAKAVVIKKKGDAACDWEKEGEAAKDYDEIWDSVKSFFTSWAKECGYKLTPEALNKFKENVYKTIVYYNTMHILKGDK